MYNQLASMFNDKSCRIQCKTILEVHLQLHVRRGYIRMLHSRCVVFFVQCLVCVCVCARVSSSYDYFSIVCFQSCKVNSYFIDIKERIMICTYRSLYDDMIVIPKQIILGREIYIDIIKDRNYFLVNICSKSTDQI